MWLPGSSRAPNLRRRPAHALAHRAHPPVPPGEHRDDAVGLAQLVDAQHDRLVPIQRHAAIVPPPGDIAGQEWTRERRALSAAMRIAVIGTGNIGGTLGSRWQQAGHDVVFGGRAPRADGPGGSAVVAIPEAVAGADVVVLALPGGAVAELLGQIGPQLAGVVVVDATNNLRTESANAREAVTSSAPGAHYVRAFNTLGWENFAEPLPDADLFFAADADARAIAEELITAFGLRPVYVGDGSAANTVDALLRLWFALSQERGGNRRLAFRLVE